MMDREIIQSIINGLNETGIHQEYALFFVSPSDFALWSFLLAAMALTFQLMPLGSNKKR